MLIASTAFVSCDEEVIQYDNVNGQTLVKFDESATRNVGVEINNSGSVDLTITASTISDADRTVNISLVSSDVDENDLQFNETVTIPAGEYAGTLTVTIVDSGLAIGEDFDIVFNIDGLSGDEDASIPSPTQTVRANVVCPIPEDFMVGNYEIEDLNAAIGPGNNTENFAAGVVEISIGDNNNERVFEVGVLPAFNNEIETVVINLNCDVFQLGEVDPSVSCGDDVPYVFGRTSRSNSSVYDVEGSDAFFVIEYVEDVEGSCGGPYASSFILTKVD